METRDRVAKILDDTFKENCCVKEDEDARYNLQITNLNGKKSITDECRVLKFQNSELLEKLENWREPFIEQDKITGNWWVYSSHVEVSASANTDMFHTREEAEARLKELNQRTGN